MGEIALIIFTWIFFHAGLIFGSILLMGVEDAIDKKDQYKREFTDPKNDIGREPLYDKK